MSLEIFQYGFVMRGLEAGILIAATAPLIGIFLVLKRYSLIADTLAHASLAGVAIGLFLGINPVLAALAASVLSSLGIEKLRDSKKVYGESALALFLSGSLALAVVLISLAHGFNSNLFNYLFGSIVTVTQSDVNVIFALSALTVLTVAYFYKELVYASFDEEAAQVSGVPVHMVNRILIVLAALTVAFSITIVGALLISALIVIPVVSAFQLRRGFLETIIYAEFFSLLSVVLGILVSFYLNLSTGGTIVLIMLGIFMLIFAIKYAEKK